jgi:cytoskeleton protein RodZ
MTRERAPEGLGPKLQEARTRRGVSLSQLAESTKIPVSTLQALERNDISRLPGGVLSRGFVRSFATAAGLDPEATVAEFVAQFPLESVTAGYPAAQRVDQNEVSDPRPSEGSSTLHWWKASALLRSVAIAVFPAALVVYLATTNSWSPWAAMPGRTATAPAAPANTPVRLDVTPPSDQQDAGSAAGDLPVAADVADPAAANFASGSPSTNAESALDTNRSEEPGAVSREPLAVVLSVTSPSWVIATVDGTRILNRLIEVGEQEMFEAHRDLVLTAGDAGAIVMTLNGVLAKSLGRPGETITARVSRTNFKHYLSP